jgi:hypothetical protein
MEETVMLTISLRRIQRATKNALTAIEKEVEFDEDSAYHKLLPPLRALSKYLYRSRE